MKPESIWIHDDNRRRYTDDQGNRTSYPDYRDQWVERKVTGETSQSWLIEYGGKVPKRKDKQFGVAFSQQEVDDLVWQHDHAYKISEKVHKADAETLKKVAEIIGYTK